MSEFMDSKGMNVFNATSMCSSLMLKLSKGWSNYARSNKKFGTEAYIRAYTSLKRKIVNRRTDVDKFYESYAKGKDRMWNPWVIVSDDLKFKKKELLYDCPLLPYECTVSKKGERTNKHLEYKLRNVNTFNIKAITRSAISTHAIYSEFAKKRDIVQRFRGVRWDTLAPKSKHR
jgi:hypothetical protein